ncbi:hypothetical protein AB3N61_02970 [Leptospira sp. WS58.C1]|nr:MULTISPECIES: hypothetical protein [unclassified Leptospira]
MKNQKFRLRLWKFYRIIRPLMAILISLAFLLVSIYLPIKV